MMKSLLPICAVGMAVASLAGAPVAASPVSYGGAQLIEAQFFGQQRGSRGGDRFERRGNYWYYNNHRGSRERRPGWRQFRGFWFPPAAFTFGFTVNPPRQHRPSYNRMHIEWCYDRYRSYRESDNSFQPYNGPRRACVSPYPRY